MAGSAGMLAKARTPATSRTPATALTTATAGTPKTGEHHNDNITKLNIRNAGNSRDASNKQQQG
jgi:hypothetical protein